MEGRFKIRLLYCSFQPEKNDIASEKVCVWGINKNVTKDGRIIICDWFNTTLINKDGKAIGVASICKDITEQKRMERELAKYREHLEEQVKERNTELEAANKV